MSNEDLTCLIWPLTLALAVSPGVAEKLGDFLEYNENSVGLCRWERVYWHTLNPEIRLSLSCLTEARPVEVLPCKSVMARVQRVGANWVRQPPPTTI